MTNGNLETRVAALEAEVQEIRALLREAATTIVALTQAHARTQQQIDSNARSIQAWEALIEQNRVEAEEERSRLQVAVLELIEANQQNRLEHELFRRRLEAIDPQSGSQD
ncbi:MAG: hypothetical protein EDM05_042570 [Leptolyngbya sp. IPPAS B-1204]|nr:MAG: hypothetical protein EDM05_09535 [Leptolyngbya sp. IPPAS B-1204]